MFTVIFEATRKPEKTSESSKSHEKWIKHFKSIYKKIPENGNRKKL
jgi:hypothetical protein